MYQTNKAGQNNNDLHSSNANLKKLPPEILIPQCAGGLVLLAIGILTPYFEYIPKSSLSAVLITAVLFMLDFTILKDLWMTNKRDFLNWIGVFAVCILGGVELGLLFGIIINLIFIITRLANPKVQAIVENINGHLFIHIIPGTDIYYAGADHLRNKIKSICLKYDYKYPVFIECKNLSQCDYTLIQILGTILKELEDKNVQVYLQSLNLKAKKHLTQVKSKAILCVDALDFEKNFIKNNSIN